MVSWHSFRSVVLSRRCLVSGAALVAPIQSTTEHNHVQRRYVSVSEAVEEFGVWRQRATNVDVMVMEVRCTETRFRSAYRSEIIDDSE